MGLKNECQMSCVEVEFNPFVDFGKLIGCIYMVDV